MSKKIKNYIIERSIAKGSFGEVFTVKDELTNQIKAIKMIPLSRFENEPKLKKLFFQEAALLKKCNNENITKFYDFLESKRNIYIVMEYCQDGNMSDYLLKHKISEKEACNIMKQLLNGFQELHKFNVMHRDFKPDNVLVHNGVFKIADLGFASTKDFAKTILGTITYMAPEIINTQVKNYDSKIDIWSLGVVLYEILFGKKLFSGSDRNEVENKILNEPLKFDDAKIKLSEVCVDLLTKMLQKNPDLRISWLELIKHPFFMEKSNINHPMENALGDFISCFDIKLNNSIVFYEKVFNDNAGNKYLPNNDVQPYIMKEFTIENKDKQDNKNNEFEEFKNAEVGNENNKPHEAEENKKHMTEDEIILLNKQNTDLKQKNEHMKNLEIKYLFVKNLLNHMVKIFRSGLKMSKELCHCYAYLVFFKNVARHYKSIVLAIKNSNYFDFPNFEDFSKSLIYDEYLKLFDQNLSDLDIDLNTYTKDIENRTKYKKLTRLVEDLSKIYIEELNDEMFERLFKKIIYQFLKNYKDIVSSLVKYNEELSIKDIKLQFLLFFDCLDWQRVFIFNEDHEFGFDFDDYYKFLLKQDVTVLSRKLDDGNDILINNDFNFKIDFNYLSFQNSKNK